MEKQDVIFINDMVEELLDSQTNSSIANFITHEACKEYYHNFKKQWVPSSFLEFYFEEYKRCAFLSKQYLEPFFKLYNDDSVTEIVDNYKDNFYSLILKRKTTDQVYYYIDKSFYLEVTLSDSSILGGLDQDLYKNLAMIKNQIAGGDELLSIKELYENYLIRQAVLDSSLLNSSTTLPNNDNKSNGPIITKAVLTNNEKENVSSTSQQPHNPTLVGDQSDIPDQKGKIVKLVFPKLSLPSSYPVSNEKSRINSEHRASKFVKVDRQVTLINEYKFNGVKYKQSFIDKRKAAQKPKKRTFNFDF